MDIPCHLGTQPTKRVNAVIGKESSATSLQGVYSNLLFIIQGIGLGNFGTSMPLCFFPLKSSITLTYLVIIFMDASRMKVAFVEIMFFFYLIFFLFSNFQRRISCMLAIISCIFIKIAGFEKFSRLSKLEVLYLDFNHFNNSILSFASGIPSLKKLYLTENALNGSIHIQGI